MKNTLIILSLMLICSFASGQSVKVESSTEEMDTTKFKGLKRGYNRIIMAEREELTLVKVDLLGLFGFLVTNIDSISHDVLLVSIEKKFKPEWSWNAGFGIQVGEESDTQASVRGAVRYYFNMEKRISKGKSANNFSANYVSSRLVYRGVSDEEGSEVSLDLIFGIQRRLWRYGYLDFDVGLENVFLADEKSRKRVDLILNLEIGIAF